MKRILTSAFLILSFFLVQATPKKGVFIGSDDQLKMQAIEQTRRLATKIGLNEADYIRIKNITFEKLMALREAEEMYAHNAELKNDKVKAIEAIFNQHIASALSAKHHKEYMALVSSK